MSQSFAGDPGRERKTAASPEESLDEQLAAEIADHLASAASDQVRRGQSEEQAAQLAQQRFGNVARIKRQVWWIHNGEEVMYRTVGIALLALLTIGVAVVGFGGWQMQHNLSVRTEELSAKLETLTATQEAMLAQQRPPDVSGIAYLGDPSRPAKDVEIQVYRFSEEPATVSRGAVTASGVVTRRFRTDAQGRFDSGTLPSGAYCLLAPLLDPEGKSDANDLLFSRLQSQPLYLFTGLGKSTVDLNLLAPARLTLEVKDIPDEVRIGLAQVKVLVWLAIRSDDIYGYLHGPLSPSDSPPRDGWPLPLPPATSDAAGASLPPAKLPHSWWLPPRKYEVQLGIDFPSGNVFGGTQSHLSKSVKLDVDLTANTMAKITLNVIGEPLEEQVAYDADPDAYVGLPNWLQQVAPKIELNAALE